MGCSTAELREKDVISAQDGKKLGFISDFEIDASCGKITAILVSPFAGTFCFPGSRNEYRIPWDKIQCIGEDAVLVCPGDWSSGCETCQGTRRRKRGGWLF